MNNLKLTEIEIHNTCNRKCNFCPNAFLDRGKYTEMDEETYLSILNELNNNNYNGAISYSRYNEPFFNADLLKKRVSQAKEILPESLLVTNTNGDFLSEEALDGLLIDELTIMDYDYKGQEACVHHLLDIGAEITSVEYPFIYAKRESIKIIYFVDWLFHVELEDRGGQLRFVDRIKRSNPCFEPTYFVGIDYDGTVVPCCHIRGDSEEQQEMVLGNLRDGSVSEILASSHTCEVRNRTQNKQFSDPCKHCQKTEGRYTKKQPSMDYEIQYYCEEEVV